MKESDILKQIMGYLAVKNVFAFRVGTGKFFFEGRAFVSHTLGPGTADILAPAPGSLWIEVKNEQGRQSYMQKMFENSMVERGDRYVLARSIDDLEGVL